MNLNNSVRWCEIEVEKIWWRFTYVKLNDFSQRLSEYECHTKGEISIL